jgi:hypothetical protein
MPVFLCRPAAVNGSESDALTQPEWDGGMHWQPVTVPAAGRSRPGLAAATAAGVRRTSGGLGLGVTPGRESPADGGAASAALPGPRRGSEARAGLGSQHPFSCLACVDGAMDS